MNKTSRNRPLAFEQMEQRLALTAAPAGDFTITLGPHWQLTTNTGGAIEFDQVFIAGSNDVHGTLASYESTRPNHDRGFVDIRNGEFVFIGPVFSKPDATGNFESSEAGSSVTPIPQPQIGNGEIAEGLIAVAEIFRPTKATILPAVDESLVENAIVETTVARTTNDSWKSISLSRGRDVYFEVAALTNDHEANNRNENAELSSKIAPLIYQQTLERRETERAASTTSQESTKTPRQVPPQPVVPQQEPQPADSKHLEIPVSGTGVEQNQRTAQDSEVPQVDEVSQAADPRDQVFAVWNDGDELSDEIIALRTESQQSQSTKWPVLAAIAATSWIARNRRSKGCLNCK